MERRNRQKVTCLRPRPVTATVTKPSWMRPEAIARPRSASAESRGSTASLTSILDHDSIGSVSDDEYESPKRHEPVTNKEKVSARKENVSARNKENVPAGGKYTEEIYNNTFTKKEKKVMKKKIMRKFVETSQNDETEDADDEAGMSPWEQWLIQKVKDDRRKRKEERLKRQEEKKKKQEEETEKQKKLQKADENRKEWVDRKTFEEKLKIKVEKQRNKTEKMIKEEQKRMEQVKADRKFQEWLDQKRQEARDKKYQEKVKALEDEKSRREQEIRAKQKFEEWCRKAEQKPKPLPNSFGYTSGKLTGYHDTSAYPVPTFYNPMPWQPIHIPRPASEKRKSAKRSKPKARYVWNPEKYR